MNLFKGIKIFAVLIIVPAVSICCPTNLKAEWQKVQSNPITLYRDTDTGLVWSVTLGSAGNSHTRARRMVQHYGLRLPSWEELRDVVNNNNAVDWLDMEDGLLDLYETDDPGVLAGAYGGSISTKRPRQAITRTWVIGVSDDYDYYEDDYEDDDYY